LITLSRNQILIGVTIAVIVTFINQATSCVADKWQSNAWDEELEAQKKELADQLAASEARTEKRLNPLDVSRLDFSIDRRERTVQKSTESKKKLEIQQGSDREQWSEPVRELWNVYDAEQQKAAHELTKLEVEREAVFKEN